MTLDTGFTILEKAYKSILLKNSITVDPQFFVKKSEQEPLSPRLKEVKIIHDEEQIIKIGVWLLKEHRVHFLGHYSEIRGAQLMKNIKNIAEAQKTFQLATRSKMLIFIQLNILKTNVFFQIDCSKTNTTIRKSGCSDRCRFLLCHVLLTSEFARIRRKTYDESDSGHIQKSTGVPRTSCTASGSRSTPNTEDSERARCRNSSIASTAPPPLPKLCKIPQSRNGMTNP